MKNIRISLTFILLLAASYAFAAGERYIRYRLLEPATSSIAAVRVINHIYGSSVGFSWTGAPLPGTISLSGFYVPAGKWSDWYLLPDAGAFWGTVYLDFTGAQPITKMKAEVQVATAQDEKRVARTVTAASETGASVGLVVPQDVLDKPNWIESVEAGLQRRERVAQEVTVPVDKRPRQLLFTPSGVMGDPTILNGQEREVNLTRLLGMNTWSATEGKVPEGARYYALANEPLSTAEIDGLAKTQAAIKATGTTAQPAFAMLTDEPGWGGGFGQIWKETGEQGFRDFLRARKVDPAVFGKKSLDEVNHIPRETLGYAGVAANAPIEQRRLWYWSCEYTQYANASCFARVTKYAHEKLPGIPTTANFPVHHITLGAGMCSDSGLDYFEFGRQHALDLYWQEDWMSAGLTSWGNGLWQKVAYLASLERAAARYDGGPIGFYPISIGFDPDAKGTDHTASARVNMLLGRGVKEFSFFNYGPTSRGTVDFWADNAAIMRGIADAAGLCGGAGIEPLLYAGKPVPGQTALIQSPTAEAWQHANNRLADGREKENLYCMLTQRQIPVEIIDSEDLSRFIGQFKAAYYVDLNIERKSADDLAAWVKAGGVLVLWPDACTRDEYNEPFAPFPAEPGQQALGKGFVVRFPDRVAGLWWEKTAEMSRAAGFFWPARFDVEQRQRACAPALELAKVARPVTVSEEGIVADALVSADGVAVPLTNPLAVQDGGATFKQITVTLADGTGLTRAVSARHGKLALTRTGKAVSVTLPLDCTDIVCFWKK